jgi:hypothetical protein
MGRRARAVPGKKVTFILDEELWQMYDLLLEDPVAKRNAYGKKSKLVETLLRRLLEATQMRHETIGVNDLVTMLRGFEK